MLVYKSEGQNIYLDDVVKVGTTYYIVAYDMRIVGFILYPLDGHSLPIQHINILDTQEWIYLGNIDDPGCCAYIEIAGGVPLYLSQMESVLTF